MKRILIAIDGTLSANRALDYAAELAKRLDGELLIVNVTNVAGFSEKKDFDNLAGMEHTTVGDLRTAFSQQILAQAADRARSLGVNSLRVISPQGGTADAINEIAQSEKVSSIIVGRRGRGWIAGTLRGSVS
jgi:nucleotide-binding universal stress UspA family protein